MNVRTVDTSTMWVFSHPFLLNKTKLDSAQSAHEFWEGKETMSDFFIRECEGKFEVCFYADVSNEIGESHTVIFVDDVFDSRMEADKHLVTIEADYMMPYGDETCDDDGLWYSGEEMADDWNTFDHLDDSKKL